MNKLLQTIMSAFTGTTQAISLLFVGVLCVSCLVVGCAAGKVFSTAPVRQTTNLSLISLGQGW